MFYSLEKTQLFEEAISLCEDILARSTVDRWRDCAKQILLVMYADLGKTEKALELAYQMPTPRCTCEYMLTYILRGDDLKNRRKLNAVIYYQIFRESVLTLSEEGLTAQNILNQKELAIAGIGENEYLAALANVLSVK